MLAVLPIALLLYHISVSLPNNVSYNN